MLQALRNEHRTTLLSWEAPNLAACNRFFGTSLRSDDFDLRLAPWTARRVGALTPIPLALVKHGLLLRQARRLAPAYDLLLTADNEADFGRRGIQYIHYPKLDLERPAVDLRWYHGPRALRALYHHLGRRIGGITAAGVRRNLTLVNSEFIAARVRALHGIEPVVLHPPVPGEFPAVPWEAREDGFALVGRISPEKRIDVAIAVLRRVRERGFPVRLHVVGTNDDPAYTARIRDLAAAEAAWMTLHEDLARPDLLALLARQRYGIHAMHGEHFGIAVAEMMRAGCIVFVPRAGGPIEIVGADDRLLFETPDDAVEKIMAVLRDSERRMALQAYLAQRARCFSSETFVTRFRDLVRSM
jgi:glycosyltransferase involved in cell wall biosynthesis